MFLEPEYAQNIIVGVVFHRLFAWYVTEKEFWYLDYPKYEQALKASGYQTSLPPVASYRFNIAVLNEETVDRFLPLLAERAVSAEVLSHMMVRRRRTAYDDLLDFAPCFLVNFDQRRFSSQYPEMIRFERYVPDGWTGVYKDFLSEVPEEERYWIVDGQSLYEH